MTDKLLPFQTWVTAKPWYSYAQGHRELVPFLLVDRSPCTDPFFDPYASNDKARPLISGLCRGLKNFTIGQRFVFVTRVHPDVAEALELPNPRRQGGVYFGVAVLVVTAIHDSHETAARAFSARRYVASPRETPYPPNLAHSRRAVAAVSPDACIVFSAENKPLLPTRASPRDYRRQYVFYFDRQSAKGLRVAECRFDSVVGDRCLKLDPNTAPVLSPADWERKRLNVHGARVAPATIERLRKAIAVGR